MNIIYEDNNMIAVNKGWGVPVQKDLTGDRALIEDIAEYLNQEVTAVHVINRLDRPVGGIVLFAKNRICADDLTRQVQKRSMDKTYLAVCEGRTGAEGQLRDYLLKNQRLNTSKVVHQGTKGAKEAVLEYKRIDETEAEGTPLTLLEIKLMTGRHHQIRVQLAYSGFPIWGDRKYNPGFKHKRGSYNTALFSKSLWFTAYESKEKLLLEADFPNIHPFSLF